MTHRDIDIIIVMVPVVVKRVGLRAPSNPISSTTERNHITDRVVVKCVPACSTPKYNTR